MTFFRFAFVIATFSSFPAEAATTKGDIFACKDQANLSADAKLRGKGDQKSSREFQDSIIASGDCTSVVKNSVVSIDDRKGPLFCVRPSGGLDCYWTGGAAMSTRSPVRRPPM